MRGLVMEVKKDVLIVLKDNGEYIRIKNDGKSAIGDMVPYNLPARTPVFSFRMPRNALAVAMSLLLLCSSGLGAYGYSQPFGVVNVDINPSVAITYNWFSRVIAIEALNEDAEELIPAISNMKNHSVPEAVEALVSAASHAGYLEPELANVVFVSVSDKNDSNRTAALMAAIEKKLPEAAGNTETVVMNGSQENYQKIKKTHDSPIKDLIEKSVDGDTANDPNTLSDKPVKEILKEQKIKRDKLSPKKNEIPGSDSPGNSDSKDKQKQNPGNSDKQNQGPNNNSGAQNTSRHKDDKLDSELNPFVESEEIFNETKGDAEIKNHPDKKTKTD